MTPLRPDRRTWLRHTAASLASAGAWACSPAAAAPRRHPEARVVQLLDMSAAQQESSRNYATGLRLAWAEASRSTAALPSLVTLETDGTPASTGRALDAVATDPSVCALVGTAGERLAVQSVQDLGRRAPELAHLGPWLADTSFDDLPQLACLFAGRDAQIRHALRSLEGMGIQELALVYPDAEMHRTLGAGLQSLARELGLRAVALVPPASSDVAALARDLPATAPPVMLFLGATLELARFALALPPGRRQRYLIALADVDLPTLQQLWTRPPLPVILTQVVPVHQGQIAAVRRFRHLLKELYDEPPSPVSLAGYLAGRYALEVLRRAGEPTRTAVVQEVRRRSTVELDGFRVEFPPGRARGSRYVTQTLLSVDGRLIA
ncbi:ABC transporter substrate-binding protein [Schlegelella aquatica]|uniref:ABC transporter substrate-binding protein n=1 Tax=Caldimonas aquatica TaxID=376175 RepID=UPI0037539E71